MREGQRKIKSKVIFVKKVPGISVVDWDVDFEVRNCR